MADPLTTGHHHKPEWVPLHLCPHCSLIYTRVSCWGDTPLSRDVLWGLRVQHQPLLPFCLVSPPQATLSKIQDPQASQLPLSLQPEPAHPRKEGLVGTFGEQGGPVGGLTSRGAVCL